MMPMTLGQYVRDKFISQDATTLHTAHISRLLYPIVHEQGQSRAQECALLAN